MKDGKGDEGGNGFGSSGGLDLIVLSKDQRSEDENWGVSDKRSH